jgi:hypothetical protein
MNFETIGADVEVFALNPTTKDFISLCDKIGGTKEHPLPIETLGYGFAIQEDNVSLEFNIPACSTPSQWNKNIIKMTTFCDKLLKDMQLEMSIISAAEFNEIELSNPKALVFGCEPDYNAWTKKENPKPVSNNPKLRTAGGHIHLGSSRNMLELVQNMDLLLGIPSIILDNSPQSKMRRELYGKAGAMRPKPYGIEYRVLSNFWIFKQELINWVYNQTVEASKFKYKFKVKDMELITKTINTGDEDAARKIISDYGIALP